MNPRDPTVSEEKYLRVLHGTLLGFEIHLKEYSATSPCYHGLFTKDGKFKRHSVILGKIALENLPQNIHLSQFTDPLDITPPANAFTEGAARQVTVTNYERNIRARNACIEKYGSQCCICGFDFGITYGDIAKGYIHVHHLTPLNEIKKEYTINPDNGLRPVCPNCHAVIHLDGKTRSIEEVANLIKKQKENFNS